MKPSRQRKSVDSPIDSREDDYQAEDAAAISKFFRRGSSQLIPARKAFQLCRQVAETLNALLSGECRDEILQTLYVESVTPAPDATQLLVTVQLLDSQTTASSQEILAHLHNASSWFRAEVAATITRRKAPHLVFQIHPHPAIPDRSTPVGGNT